MWLETVKKNGDSELFETSEFKRFNVIPADKIPDVNSIVVGWPKNGNKPDWLGFYKMKATADSAIKLLFDAIKNGEETFTMPLEGDPRLCYTTQTYGGGINTRKAKTNGKTK